MILSIIGFITEHREKQQVKKRAIEAKMKAEMAENSWRMQTEPQQRNAAGYPEDWERRRVMVYLRQNGICEDCGETCGSLSCGEAFIWYYQLNMRLLQGAHVHHKIPLTRGGNHSLSNLALLCEACHITKHPKSKKLLEHRKKREKRKRDERRRMIHFSGKARTKSARKKWICSICLKPIYPGQRYYGDDWNKACFNCKLEYNLF